MPYNNKKRQTLKEVYSKYTYDTYHSFFRIYLPNSAAKIETFLYFPNIPSKYLHFSFYFLCKLKIYA